MVIKKINLKLNRKQKKRLIFGVYVLLLLITVYHFYYAKKIIPGVQIGAVDAGGMNYAQAKNALLNQERSIDKKILLEYEGKTFEFDPSLFELEYNIDATVVRAFEVGRTGNFLIDSKEKVAGLLKPLRIRAFYDLDDNLLSNVFSTIQGEINETPQNAYYEIVDGELGVIPAKSGKKVNGKKLYDSVIYSIENFDFSKKPVEVKEDKALLSEEHLYSYVSDVKKIVFNELTVTFGDMSWELSPEQLLSFIEIEVVDNKGPNTNLVLNKPVFEAFIDTLAQEVNKLPRGKVTSVVDGRIVGFEITQEGQELNIKEFTEDFKDAFFNLKSNVALPVTIISELDDPSKYGIFTLLGEGTSKYTGSAASRAHNLNLAAERTSGVLVPPNGIYSFNNSVGDINGGTGYASAYVISNGRTVLGDGGGVCQTSTTLFRAVLNAGLPVVTRHPHAYRVHYYEIESQLGMDASIYQPSLDFQFKNDTPNYVLVQSFVDKEKQLLGFRIYGTPDGRKVEISDSVITNQSPPPEPLYQDDPSLAEGVVKQVDFSAWGATASFDRIVFDKNGEVMFKDTFTTNYQPWRAIYLVGTKKI